MSSYKDSGVDISAGDIASKNAYSAAKKTFSSRDGMIGKPYDIEGGFAGALDMGEYLLVNNCDGVGTKIDIACETRNYAGLGNDLLAMTADDAICLGAEVISITNTIDTNKIDADEISAMMESLSSICIQEKITIPGGEIAELGNTLNKTIWNSSSTGIVEKDKLITGENIKAGDSVITLQENGFRSNGFSLVRYILENNNIKFSDQFNENSHDKKTWGDVLLTPSILYHSSLLNILGRFGEERKVNIKGIVHVTGGGLAGNMFRILKNKNLGADLPSLFPMPPAMTKLQELGDTNDREAYKTWNGGNGMLLICDQKDEQILLELLDAQNISAKKAGVITDDNIIRHQNNGYFGDDEMLVWEGE